MIVPGILESDFEEVKAKINLVENVADLIQIDVMDGKFVAEKTFLNLKLLDDTFPQAKLELHLMVEDPMLFLREKLKYISRVYVHIESAVFMDDFVRLCTDFGYEAGLCINPETSVELIEPHLQDIKFVQFMTVVPGGQGRPLDKIALQKAAKFKNEHPEIFVQADGGLTIDNVGVFAKSGIDAVEAGRALFGEKDPAFAYNNLSKLFKEAKI